MLATNPVGRDAQTRKYDILTALGVHACLSDAGLQRLTLRLMTLVTARYNWRTDEMTVGRRDIARMWGVEERTVKREFTKLKALGWVVVKRAGVRGRVTAYGLDLSQMLKTTEPAWAAVGPDFVARMELLAGPAPGRTERFEAATKDLAGANVVQFRARAEPDGSAWGRAQDILRMEDPAIFNAWFAALTLSDCDGETVELAAPSRFHASYIETHLMGRIWAALLRVEPGLRVVRVGAG